MMDSYPSVPASAGVTVSSTSPSIIAAAVFEISSIRVCIRSMMDVVDWRIRK